MIFLNMVHDLQQIQQKKNVSSRSRLFYNECVERRRHNICVRVDIKAASQILHLYMRIIYL